MKGRGLFAFSPFFVKKRFRNEQMRLAEFFFQKYIDNMDKKCKFMFIFASSDKINEKYELT